MEEVELMQDSLNISTLSSWFMCCEVRLEYFYKAGQTQLTQPDFNSCLQITNFNY